MVKYYTNKGEFMSIIIMLLLLSVLILVHEAGHFLAAKAFGIKVEKNSRYCVFVLLKRKKYVTFA